MIAHTLSRFLSGGVIGVQSTQRDWSPFVAHFTSYSAMAGIRNVVDTRRNHRPVVSALAVHRRFSIADTQSFNVFQQIVAARELRASHPAGDAHVPRCVCFSECNLPSLITHAERYGRFGFVFRKNDILNVGARPCAYLTEEYRNLVRETFFQAVQNGDPNADLWRQLLALTQLYRPCGSPGRTQDYCHEREWRLFANLNLGQIVPIALLSPRSHLGQVRNQYPGIDQVVSLDDLFEWGA